MIISNLQFKKIEDRIIARFVISGCEFRIPLYSHVKYDNPKFNDDVLDDYIEDFLEIYKPILEKSYSIERRKSYSFDNYNFYNAVNIICCKALSLEMYKKCIRGEYLIIKN